MNVSGLDFHALPEPWWPYVFILLAGWLPTDLWRVLGVLSAGRLDETSPVIVLTRTIATGMAAAVIARLVLYPTGSLATVPTAVRIAALAAGFLAYLGAGQRILVAILVAEIVLVAPTLVAAMS